MKRQGTRYGNVYAGWYGRWEYNAKPLVRGVIKHSMLAQVRILKRGRGYYQLDVVVNGKRVNILYQTSERLARKVAREVAHSLSRLMYDLPWYPTHEDMRGVAVRADARVRANGVPYMNTATTEGASS